MFTIFGLKSMIKQLLNLVYGFLHLKCIIKQLLDSVFVICKIINVVVRYGKLVQLKLEPHVIKSRSLMVKSLRNLFDLTYISMATFQSTSIYSVKLGF